MYFRFRYIFTNSYNINTSIIAFATLHKIADRKQNGNTALIKKSQEDNKEFYPGESRRRKAEVSQEKAAKSILKA